MPVWTFRCLAKRLADAGTRSCDLTCQELATRPHWQPTASSPRSIGARSDRAPARPHGIEQLTLIAFGIGALLAFNEAQRKTIVKSVELIQAFVNGDRYVLAVEPDLQARANLPGGRLFSNHFLAVAEEKSLRELAATFRFCDPPLETNIISFDSDPVEFQQHVERAEGAVRDALLPGLAEVDERPGLQLDPGLL